MKKWKLVGGLMLIFALGVVAGSLTSQIIHRQRFENMRKDPAARKAFFLERLTKKLDLTEAQREAFIEIIDRIDEKRREHFERGRLQIQAIMDEGFLDMKNHLTPEQQTRLEDLRKKARRALGPPPPPPPGQPPPD
ncbi:MAG: hypothetical protein ACOWYE_13990 [Desulfatiglandales bacterium]